MEMLVICMMVAFVVGTSGAPTSVAPVITDESIANSSQTHFSIWEGLSAYRDIVSELEIASINLIPATQWVSLANDMAQSSYSFGSEENKALKNIVGIHKSAVMALQAARSVVLDIKVVTDVMIDVLDFEDKKEALDLAIMVFRDETTSLMPYIDDAINKLAAAGANASEAAVSAGKLNGWVTRKRDEFDDMMEKFRAEEQRMTEDAQEAEFDIKSATDRLNSLKKAIAIKKKKEYSIMGMLEKVCNYAIDATRTLVTIGFGRKQTDEDLAYDVEKQLLHLAEKRGRFEMELVWSQKLANQTAGIVAQYSEREDTLNALDKTFGDMSITVLHVTDNIMEKKSLLENISELLSSTNLHAKYYLKGPEFATFFNKLKDGAKELSKKCGEYLKT